MELHLLRVFQRQVLLQCEFIKLAAADVNAGLTGSNVTRTFYGLENLLNAALNISKALWGQGQNGSVVAERKPLRDSIGVDDNSPFNTVKMRNNFERFDERIDTWWRRFKDPNVVDPDFGPRSATDGFDTTNLFRAFDASTNLLWFWGQEFNVQALVSEVERVLPKVREEANKPTA